MSTVFKMHMLVSTRCALQILRALTTHDTIVRMVASARPNLTLIDHYSLILVRRAHGASASVLFFP